MKTLEEEIAIASEIGAEAAGRLRDAGLMPIMCILSLIGVLGAVIQEGLPAECYDSVIEMVPGSLRRAIDNMEPGSEKP